jgi:acyl carrier protein
MSGEKSERLTVEELQSFLSERIAKWLGSSPEEVELQVDFMDYSLDSIALASISGDLEERLGRRLPPSLLWEHSTIERLSIHLAQLLNEDKK